MLDVGIRYLQAVGPAYGLFGLGMALYFASQGAGRLLWPLLANVTRLIIAAGGGWLALRWSANLFEVFVAQALSACDLRPNRCRRSCWRRLVRQIELVMARGWEHRNDPRATPRILPSELRSPVDCIDPLAGLDLDVYATKRKALGGGEPL
jgi:hypothetical protein